MIVFRVSLLVVWAIVMYFTVLAIYTDGLAMATEVFSGDMLAGNWRSQFNIDLLSHMYLVGVWVAWRQRFSGLGILLGLLCICGGLFSLVYVLALTFFHKGNLSMVLMGKSSPAVPA